MERMVIGRANETLREGRTSIAVRREFLLAQISDQDFSRCRSLYRSKQSLYRGLFEFYAGALSAIWKNALIRKLYVSKLLKLVNK